MIKPTVGRVVLYHPLDDDGDAELRHAATIAFVHNDGLVNLGIVDSNGVAYSERDVRLCQDDDICLERMCEWMPYQKGQAAKTEQLEKAGAKTDEEIKGRIDELQKKEGDSKEPAVVEKPKKTSSKKVAKATASAAAKAGNEK